MLAVGFHEYGGPENARTVQVPVPQPGPGEVRVRVVAATVNPGDVQFRRGDHAAFVQEAVPPFCGGMEFVGRVDAAGQGVDLEAGTLVAGTSHFIPGGRGAHAELVVTGAGAVAECPPDVDPAAMATVPMNGLTARVTLDALRLASGDTLVVTGAAGAVGAYVVELAVAEGIEVIAVASASDEPALRRLGVSEFVPRGVDVVDRVLAHHPGGVAAVVDTAMLDRAAVPLVRPGGQFITLRPGHVPLPQRGIEPRLVSFRRYQDRPDVLRELLQAARTGALTPRVAEVLTLAEGREAHRLADTPGLRGRVVLSVPQ
jgi:NADPH:quinone reductase-like Zn-dependent oxidoreductase